MTESTITIPDACDALDALARRTQHPLGLIPLSAAKQELRRRAEAQVSVPRQRVENKEEADVE